MKAKVVAVGAAKDLVDLGFESDVDGVLGFFDDRIEHDETAAVLEHPQHLAHYAGRIAEMVQAEGDKRAVEGVGLERQLVGLTGALQIAWNRFLMVMADVEHRQGLVDADDFPAFDLLGQRPGHPSGAGGHIEHQLLALEREHFDQFVRQRSSDIGQPAPVEVGGVRRIVKVRLVVVAVTVGGAVFVLVIGMAVFVFVAMGMIVLVIVVVTVLVLAIVRMTVLGRVRVFVLSCPRESPCSWP